MKNKTNGEPQTQVQSLLIDKLTAAEEHRELRSGERAAREAENQANRRIAMILESISDAFFAVDREGRITYVNQKAERLFRETRAELIGKYAWNQFVGPIGNRLYSGYQQIMSKNVGVHFEEFYEALGIWIEVHICAAEDGCSFYLHDITEGERSKEALKESQEYAKSLIDSSLDMMIAVDHNRNIVTFNRAAQEASGYSPGEVLGKNVGILYAEPEQGLKVHAKTMKEGRCVQEIINVRKNGQRFPCLLSASPLHNAKGEVIGVMGVSRDITERKKAQEALRASEKRFRALFEESKDVIYMSTPEGKFVDINPAGVELFGYGSKEELLRVDLGRDIYVDPKQREQFQRRMGAQGFVKDFEEVLKRKDGEKLIVLETATAVRNAQGKLVMYRGIMRDVTQQRQLEREVLQAQKMDSLGRLAGGIAHDLNNILGIILGHISLVERSQRDPKMVASSMDTIGKAVQRGAGLVRQILTFARKTDVTLEPVDVNAAIRELSNMLEETMPRTIELLLELDEGIPTMMMDDTQLHQVLLNLCINARDAMTDSAPTGLRQGRLTIRTETIDGRQLRRKYSGATAPRYLCINVADTGVGMDEATQKKIFEPFFTTKGPGRGTGLGLAVVYGVVRSHEGQIEVESEVGRGTSIRLYFPVTERAAGPAQMPGAEYGAIRGGTESILLVEDEGGLLLLMESILKQAGYRVLTAIDGVEAVKQYVDHREEIALVLTDLGMPRLDGAALFSVLKDVNPSVKLMLASGYLEPNFKSELLKSGAKYFVQKPYVPAEVLKRIREVIDSDQ